MKLHQAPEPSSIEFRCSPSHLQISCSVRRWLLWIVLIAAAWGAAMSRVNTSGRRSGGVSIHIGGTREVVRTATIPRIIHQTWKTSNVPEKYAAWVESWKRVYPKWEYRLWTDKDNRLLIQEQYPWFLDTYDAMDEPIMRADAVRPFYMHKHGGMYADLDMEALRDLSPLLKGNTEPVFAALMDDPPNNFRHNIPNAWMASPAGHPFWQFYMARMLRRPDMENQTRYGHVEKVAGPIALMDCAEAYGQFSEKGVTVLPAGTVYAYNWREGERCDREEYEGEQMRRQCEQRKSWCLMGQQETFDAAKCKGNFPKAYAITYWAHSWG